MKIKVKFTALVALAIIFTQVFSITSIATTCNDTETIVSEASDTSFVQSDTEDNSIIQANKTTPKTFSPNFQKNVYTEQESISISFDKKNIVDFTYIAEGLDVEKTIGDSMEFVLKATDEFGKLEVTANYADGETAKSSIYTYKKGSAIYISDISEDSAWYNCMEDLYLNGELTKNEVEAAYHKYALSFTAETTPVSTVATRASDATIVQGTLTWQLENGSSLPLRQSKIELWDEDTVLDSPIATTYTDNNGYFCFTFDNPDEWYYFENGGADIYLKYYNESYTFRVDQNPLLSLGYSISPVVNNVSTGTTTTVNRIVVYNANNNTNKCTYIHQCMVLAQRFATEMGMTTDNFINIFYPGPDLENMNDSAFCWGTDLTNCYSVIGLNNFKNIDTLTHEYGHFVEVSMGNYGSNILEILTNWPTHDSSKDNFTEKPDKEYAMELTWSEAWATVFAEMAQQYYATEYIGIPFLADCKSGNGYSFESPNITANSCEAQERAVIGVLWDLFDSYQTESFDTIGLGYQNWWYYTTHEGTYTLTDFVNVIESNYTSIRDKFGMLLAQHQISPGNLKVTNSSSVSGTTPPTLTWNVNGSVDHPNDIFQVVFYDKQGKLLCETPQINCTQAYNTTFTYSVPSSVWNQITNKYGGIFTVDIAVRSYRSGSPVSGPYLSKFVPVTLTIHKSISMLSHNRYIEMLVKLDAGGYCNFTTTFATAGYKILQTFGTKDAEIQIYNSSGTLLASNDDGGYGLNAYIRHYFSANTTYTIRVKLHSASAYGETKLAITPANGILSANSTSLATFEDISGIVNSSNFTLTTYAAPKYTRMVTFTPPSSGTYTFEIQSDIDTYIYVIDPRSNEILIKGTDYDDDSGEGQNPLLSKKLSAGVKYLIIYSAYNPNTLAQITSITLRIYK